MAKSITYIGQQSPGLEAPAMKARGLQTSVRQAMNEDDLRLYSQTDWQKVRPIVIRLCGGRCVQCGSTYRLEVDHVQPLATAGLSSKPFDPAGLQVLCRPCHQLKTTEMDQAYGMARQYNPERDKRDDQLREVLTTQGRLMAAAIGVRINRTMGDLLVDAQNNNQHTDDHLRDYVGI